MNETLSIKIRSKKALCAVIGLGYVGLPLVEVLLKKGYRVIGFDISKKHISLLSKGKSYVEGVPDSVIKKGVSKRSFYPTCDEKFLKSADIIFICVPTPVTENRVPDLSYVVNASEIIKGQLREGQLIILKSTTFPETTEKVVLPILKRGNFRVGRDFFLSYVPERVNPGDKKFRIENTPVVVSGVTKNCLRLTISLYEKLVSKVYPVSSPRVAEMTKLLENIFRNVNIALVNELATLCNRMGINLWEVIGAASTKPFGFMPFYPGPGVGGHCIPVDPYYLSYKAHEYDTEIDFITLAAKTNEWMPYYTAERIIFVLNENGILPKRAKVLILGIAFKRDVGDPRNSPGIKIMELLSSKIRRLDYSDPYIPEIEVQGNPMKSVPFNAKTLKRYDLVAILTDHSAFSKKLLLKEAKLIFDTRNFFGNRKSSKIWTLGAGRKLF